MRGRVRSEVERSGQYLVSRWWRPCELRPSLRSSFCGMVCWHRVIVSVLSRSVRSIRPSDPGTG